MGIVFIVENYDIDILLNKKELEWMICPKIEKS